MPLQVCCEKLAAEEVPCLLASGCQRSVKQLCCLRTVDGK
jgi:hypothetical protein